jgi:hypothetical protein
MLFRFLFLSFVALAIPSDAEASLKREMYVLQSGSGCANPYEPDTTIQLPTKAEVDELLLLDRMAKKERRQWVDNSSFFNLSFSKITHSRKSQKN